MSGNISKALIVVSDPILKQRTEEEFIDMNIELTSSGEDADAIVSDELDFNHLYIKGVRKIILVNIPEERFEFMVADIRSLEIKSDIELSRLDIPL